MHREGLGVKKNMEESIQINRRSCDADGAKSCTDLAVSFEFGHGMSVDTKQAASLYEKACELGASDSCTNLGLCYANGTGVDKDELQAATLYERGCKADDFRGCTKLAAAYFYAAGVPQDLPKAVKFAQFACDNAYGEGCVVLGVLLQQTSANAAEPGNVSTAKDAYTKGCDAGEMSGCYNLALLYLTGQGVTKDENSAKVLLDKACKGGLGMACAYMPRIRH